MLCTPCLKKNPKTNGYELTEREHFVSRTRAVSRTGPGLYQRSPPPILLSPLAPLFGIVTITSPAHKLFHWVHHWARTFLGTLYWQTGHTCPCSVYFFSLSITIAVLTGDMVSTASYKQQIRPILDSSTPLWWMQYAGMLWAEPPLIPTLFA